MDEQELEKQFEATDYDKDGNIKTLSAQPAAAKKKRVTVADLKKDITEIEDLLSERIPKILAGHENRLDKIELELKPQTEQGAKFVWDKLDNQNAAIGALADALRQHLEEAAAAPPEPKQELMFAQPPAHPEPVTATKGDIEAVASVCQTMADVLMICRALKAVPDLPDDDRTYLLTTACRAAGVPLSVGLQIRAGAKYREA